MLNALTNRHLISFNVLYFAVPASNEALGCEMLKGVMMGKNHVTIFE